MEGGYLGAEEAETEKASGRTHGGVELGPMGFTCEVHHDGVKGRVGLFPRRARRGLLLYDSKEMVVEIGRGREAGGEW